MKLAAALMYLESELSVIYRWSENAPGVSFLRDAARASRRIRLLGGTPASGMRMLDQEPRLFLMHFRADTDAVALARMLHSAIAHTRSKLAAR